MPEAPTYLNLGCGSRYHPEWVNVDIAPHSPQVMQHDLSRRLPFSDASFDVVYHSAVLEHMRRADAPRFLMECYRVLKPGGILRVGVPDLEQICQLYLSKLHAASTGDEKAGHDYEWMLLELLDQAVRERGGGQMLEYLQQDPLPNSAFVFARIGEEGRQLVRSLHDQQVQEARAPSTLIRRLWKRWRDLPMLVRRYILRGLMAEEDRKAFDIGRFRVAGEVHQWMYDRYSLARLLEQTGFQSVSLQAAATSQIPGWDGFRLDTLPSGEAVKPDLLFMEALKMGDNSSV